MKERAPCEGEGEKKAERNRRNLVQWFIVRIWWSRIMEKVVSNRLEENVF